MVSIARCGVSAFLLALGVGGVAPACGSGSVFTCATDEQCTMGGAAGQCESTGYCSFLDPECPSGRRYGSHATAGLAGVCTSPLDEGSGTGPEGSDDGSVTTSGDDAPFTTTLGLDDGTSTSGPIGGSSSGSDAGPGTSGDTSTGQSSNTDTSGDTSTDTGTDTASSNCPTFSDDFEDGVIDPQWSVWSPAKVAELGGEIQFTHDPAANAAAGIDRMGSIDMQNGWVRAEVGSFPPATVSDQLYVYVFESGTSDGVFFLIEGPLLVARRDDGASFENYMVADFDPIAHAWLQLRGEKGQVVFETSADGVLFETFATVDAPFPLDAVGVALVGTNWAALEEANVSSFAAIEACASPGG